MAWSLMGLGDIAAAQNKVAEAEQLYNQALNIQQELNDYDHAGVTLEALGRLEWRQGNYEQAFTLLQESLTLRIIMDDPTKIAQSLEAIASLAAAKGQAERAVYLFGAMETLLSKDGAVINLKLQPWHNQQVSQLRDQLGEATFTKAWSTGAAMKLNEIVAFISEKEAS
jgi:tetratricopeptide (TPR) repeat protein